MSEFGFRPRLKMSLLILMALLISTSTALAASGIGTVLYESGFDADRWSWETNSDGSTFPVLEGTHNLSEPGLPILPIKNLLLLIPVGKQVDQAWIEPLATHRDELSATLAVAPAHITDGGEMVATARLQIQEGQFPASWGEFSGTHTWRGYNILTLNVYPARTFASATGLEIEYLDEYAVRVVFADGTNQRMTVERERMVPGESIGNTKVLRQILSNPEALGGYARINGVAVGEDKGPFNPTRTPSLSGSPVKYLIITNEEMKSEFQRLADFKTSIGINTLVTTREFIAANFRNGADIQETMRMFIQDAYQKWGIEYLMLGGDTDILPPRYVNNSFYPAAGFTAIPVDMYFACLDGTWNANGNAYYGETDSEAGGIGDDADFAEEVYIGRATVSTVTAAQVFVDKVITYETTPAGSNWPNRVLYASEVLFWRDNIEDGEIILDGARFSHQMITELLEPCTDMEFTRMYETNELYPWDTELTRAALIDSLNTGHYGIFNQIGHGFYFNMSVGDANFMNSDADNLTNGDHLFLLFSLNCASAAFDYSCLMERFLQNPNGGSILSIGSSRAAFPNNSNNYQQGFFDALYCSDESRAGNLLAISRLPYLANTVYNYVDRWTFENYTLLGDPTTPIWTGIPEQLSVASADLSMGPNQLAITVNDHLGMGVENAMVCLSREGEDLASGPTDANGMISLDYLANAPGAVDLRVTGLDLGQNISTVNVLDGDTYLAFSNLIVGDNGNSGTVGNNNSIAEAGETVGLVPILLETAGTGTSGLNGLLTTNTPGVTITINSAAFNNVTGGGQTATTTPFLVHLDPYMVDGTPVSFRLVLTDAGAETYEVEWTTIVKAPEIEVVKLDWQDVTYGNGDGFLDSGERVIMSVQVKNFGAGLADLVDIRLRSIISNVVLYDTMGTVDDLELMETSDEVATFSLALNDASRKSQSTLFLTDNYGRITEHDFYLQRPMTPMNIETDTSLGADVIALLWDPVDDNNIFGYNVFRSDSPSGPFVRVNSDVIAGASFFRDEGLSQLTKYYYKINSMAYPLVPSAGSSVVEQSTAPAELSSFPVSFLAETSSHLAVGDVDGDGYSEIILGSDEVYVWHHDGTELLDGDNNSQTLGPLTNLNSVLQPAGIVLAPLDNQPGLEMIVADRGEVSQIHIFRKDGTELPGWPQSTHIGAGTKWAWATPAVGDIDGDGDLEIVVNTLNGRTWAWHHDGSEVYDGDNDPGTNGVLLIRDGATFEWGVSSPALYDLDGDGAKDIIFGTGSDNVGGSRLTAIKSDGTHVVGFPYFTANRVNNSPALGDLNNDGIMEIVFYDYSQNLYVVEEDGTDYPGFPVNFGFGAMQGATPSVALGDMDQDGKLEIIFAGNNSGDSSNLVIVDTDISGGTSGQALTGWPVALPGSSEGSPVVGDIDGDTIPDVLFGIGGGSEDAPNNLYAFKSNGQPIDGFPITLGGPLMPSPVICDLDRDLDVDIVMGGWDRLVHVWDMPFAFDMHNVPWPTFRGNVKRDGVLIPSYLVDVEDNNPLPAAVFQVDAPYPNPFNPSTTVRLHVPVVNGSSSLELVVYDLQGRRVRTLHNGPISSGWHTIVWDGRDNSGRFQSSGMYFMRARSGAKSSIHKMTLVK